MSQKVSYEYQASKYGRMIGENELQEKAHFSRNALEIIPLSIDYDGSIQYSKYVYH